MNYRPTRSMVRRFIPLLVVIVAALAYVIGTGSADASSGQSIGNQTQQCLGFSAFKSYHFTVDGKQLKSTFSFADLQNKTKQNSMIQLSFVLNSNCNNTFVGLNTYKAEGPDFKAGAPQTLFQKDTGTFKADGSTHTLKVQNPNCFFQVDAYTNRVFVVGQFTKAGEKSFLTADTGGTQKCLKPTTTTTEKRTTTTTAKPTTTTTMPVISNEATIQTVCKVDVSGWTVTYKNNGTKSQDFMLKGGGKTIDTVTVAAGKTSTKSYSFADNNVAAGKSIDLTVMVGSHQVAAQSVTNDCDMVSVNVTTVCNTANGVASAVFTINNTGKLDESVTIMNGSKAIDISPVAVPAGKSVTKTSVISGSGTTTFTITDPASGLSMTKSVDGNCTAVQAVTITKTPTPPAPQVLAETVSRPQLPNTGFAVWPFAGLGTTLILTGIGLLFGARRTRTAARYSHQ